MFERCLRPVIPSATLADNRLSIPPSSVKARADGSTFQARPGANTGRTGAGRLPGMPPNRVPMVSTGSLSSAARTEAAMTAISMPGKLGRSRRTAKMRPAEPSPMARAVGFIVQRAPPSTASFGKKAPGSATDSFSPPRSLSWLARMLTAIAQVNPTVTA